MKLPLLISVPHAGFRVPPEVEDLCVLTQEQIVADCDEGAATIYTLESEVAAYQVSDVARAIVDLNRAEDDRRQDGVVKTHTCYKNRVYKRPIAEDVVQILLDRYYRPYHRRLSELAKGVKLGIDCHTMAAVGPPIAQDSGARRPYICLSNAYGTILESWFQKLIDCFHESFHEHVSVNEPFKGGYIIQSHASELPWVQLELSRANFLPNVQKQGCVLNALRTFCELVL
jgi:formiminoglutamase